MIESTMEEGEEVAVLVEAGRGIVGEEFGEVLGVELRRSLLETLNRKNN